MNTTLIGENGQSLSIRRVAQDDCLYLVEHGGDESLDWETSQLITCTELTLLECVQLLTGPLSWRERETLLRAHCPDGRRHPYRTHMNPCGEIVLDP